MDRQWALGELSVPGPDPGTQSGNRLDDRQLLNAGTLAVLALFRVEFCAWSKDGNDQRLTQILKGQVV